MTCTPLVTLDFDVKMQTLVVEKGCIDIIIFHMYFRNSQLKKKKKKVVMGESIENWECIYKYWKFTYIYFSAKLECIVTCGGHMPTVHTQVGYVIVRC